MQGLDSSDRAGGVILHPTSLPGPYGIGDIGPEAHRWVDILAASGTGLWQVLPLGPTGYADSPYQCFSSFAGNPNLVSPDLLVADGLLEPLDVAAPAFPRHRVDYGAVINWKASLIDLAFTRFQAGFGDPSLRQGFDEFAAASSGWLDDFAVFMSIKSDRGGGSWLDWPAELRLREPAALAAARDAGAYRIQRERFAQYLFFRQWDRLHRHATEEGIRIIGDLPIFVAVDSADVWANPELFRLDASGLPTVVAGVPPDYFSPTGQLWGNPLYDWERHDADGYTWWVDRIAAALATADIIRIDHFRAFADYWEIPADAETAIDGAWREGPGVAFFAAVRERLHDLPVIAEDLGDLSPAVPALLEQTGFPGMRVLQFAFTDGEHDPFLPHNYPQNTVAYTGTHDNDTTLGWWESAPESEKAFAAWYLDIEDDDPVGRFLEILWTSNAMFAIAPLQDLLRGGTAARMNTPSTTDGNWQWRAERDDIGPELVEQLRGLNERHGRHTSHSHR